MADTVLYDLAHELLTTINGLLNPAIPRAFVAFGDPTKTAWDCNQLSVNVSPIISDQGGTGQRKVNLAAEKKTCSVVPKATFHVLLLKCVKVVGAQGGQRGAPPRGTDLNTEAKALYTVGWQLWHGVTSAWVQGALWNEVSCDYVAFEKLEPVGPDGGLAGWKWPIQLTSPT